jgi:iron complex outermembrane recepter protein
LLVCAVGPVMAQSLATLAPIVVTATRKPESSADLPASIDSVDAQTIRNGQLQVNLSESLMTIPGVSAESRQNYAQDLQISVRGFGARSSFGVRGVRLYSDGIPGTMPDGQGQFSQFDLSSAGRIEVLRGPFSALYGNSSGGVIAVFTEDPPAGYSVAGTVDYGTFNTQRYAIKTLGNDGSMDYVVDASHFQTDGYRYHSEAERNLFNSKLHFSLGEAGSLTVVGNAVQTPFVQDPMGLTAAQLSANPEQAGTGAIAYNTRKSLAQGQLGAVYTDSLGAHDDVTATVYTGHRETTQFQSIPQATQEAAPLYPGGVIALSRAYWGVYAHGTDQRSIGDAPLQVTGGLSYDDLEETRFGYLNYIGDELGVEGAVRRDEANHVYDFDQYLQAQFDPQPRWRLIAGVRNSTVEVSNHDHLVDEDDPDSSVRYSAVNPVAGATFRATSAVNLYASYGKGFETPTLDDLAYRSTNGSLPGLNIGLKPARSNNVEVGVKAGGEHVQANLAGFYIRAVDELAVLASSNGRAVEQNIGETQRHGAELSVTAQAGGGFSAKVAYSYIRALVAQGYVACVSAPCKPATGDTGVLPANDYLVAAGDHLPAVPINALYAGVTWAYAPQGFTATLETQGRAGIYANDRNSAFAAGYWVANARAGFTQDTKRWRVQEFASLDNLADRRYVGSVIVNETNSRFFEPAPGRTVYIMLNAALRLN